MPRFFLLSGMKLIYTNENRFLVFNARNILAHENIDVLLKNEFIGAAAGDLSPFDTWLELWVEDAFYSKAKRLLLPLTESNTSTEWTCPACGEANGAAFEICWNCHKDRI